RSRDKTSAGMASDASPLDTNQSVGKYQPIGWVQKRWKGVIMQARIVTAASVARVVAQFVKARASRFRAFPDEHLLVAEPLALAEERTNRLRRIYEKCTAAVWDGPAVFREAVARHGGIQLDEEKRKAMASIIARLMWG